MMYAGRFKFLKIFHHDDFEKLLSKTVEAFKVWACKGITAGRKFSKFVLRAKRSQKHVKIVSEWFYKLFWTFLKKLILGWKRGEKCAFFIFFFLCFFMKNCTNIEIRFFKIQHVYERGYLKTRERGGVKFWIQNIFRLVHRMNMIRRALHSSEFEEHFPYP